MKLGIFIFLFFCLVFFIIVKSNISAYKAKKNSERKDINKTSSNPSCADSDCELTSSLQNEIDNFLSKRKSKFRRTKHVRKDGGLAG